MTLDWGLKTHIRVNFLMYPSKRHVEGRMKAIGMCVNRKGRRRVGPTPNHLLLASLASIIPILPPRHRFHFEFWPSPSLNIFLYIFFSLTYICYIWAYIPLPQSQLFSKWYWHEMYVYNLVIKKLICYSYISKWYQITHQYIPKFS